MLHFFQGNLFDLAESHTLGHGVNCHGFMSAGIAKQFKARYPEMYLAYREKCLRGSLLPGETFMWHDPATDHVIANCASQERPGADAQIHWLGMSLLSAAEQCRKPLGINLIGCGIGGLQLEQALGVFRMIGDNCELTVAYPSDFLENLPSRKVYKIEDFQ